MIKGIKKEKDPNSIQWPYWFYIQYQLFWIQIHYLYVYWVVIFWHLAPLYTHYKILIFVIKKIKIKILNENIIKIQNVKIIFKNKKFISN